MRTRLSILVTAAGLLAAACTNLPKATLEFPSGQAFVPQVADSIDDVGRGNDVAVDADGVPYISYFGFKAKVEEGDIPVPRPVGWPFIPAVQVSSVADDGAWTRGAVAQATETPQGIFVPYAPQQVSSLSKLTPSNSNGTAIAVDSSGTRHVVWAADDGIWYASSSDSSTVEQVSKLQARLQAAGPLGRPDVAVDDKGVPWVAWTVNEATETVHVATQIGGGWREETVATVPQCGGCPQPYPTRIEMTPSGPVVLYVDTAADAVMAAHLQGGVVWTSEVVASKVSGFGLSSAVGKGGTVVASYYTGNGTVQLATGSPGGAWSTTEVGESGKIPAEHGNFAQTTGVAADDQGTVYVAWYDAGADQLRLVKGDGSKVEPIETEGTSGGILPSLAVAADGSKVYLAWYERGTQDLLLGTFGDVGEMVVARPSPTPSAGGGGPVATCEPDGTDLTITAQPGQVFDLNCLAVQAGKKFSVTLDNQDTVVHDFSIYPSPNEVTPEDAFLDTLNQPVTGGTDTTYPVPGIDKPGEYFFRCDFHPTSMTGSFIVK